MEHYTEEKKIKIAKRICKQLAKGKPINKLLDREENPSRHTWYKWLDGVSDSDRKVAELYAQAKLSDQDRRLYIIDKVSGDRSRDMYMGKDGVMLPNNVAVSRDTLITNNMKWNLSKSNPKKYGNQVDVTSNGESVNTLPPIQIIIDDKDIGDEIDL